MTDRYVSPYEQRSICARQVRSEIQQIIEDIYPVEYWPKLGTPAKNPVLPPLPTLSSD